MTKQYHVTLTPAERERPQHVIAARQSSPRHRIRARVLLLADTTQPDGAAPDGVISQKVRTSLATVGRIRRRFPREGLGAALAHQPQVHRKEPALDGETEAHWVALVCGAPPAGQQRWTLHLLQETLIERVYTDTVSHETVRQRLQNELKPWLKKCWCIPPEQNAEIVWHMEDVLDVYQRPYDPKRPQLCLDEASKQLLGEVREPLPLQPGQPEREEGERLILEATRQNAQGIAQAYHVPVSVEGISADREGYFLRANIGVHTENYPLSEEEIEDAATDEGERHRVIQSIRVWLEEHARGWQPPAGSSA